MKLPAILFLTGVLTAKAGVTMSLTASVKNSARGTKLIFSGTLTNTDTSAEVCLNDIAFDLTGGAQAHLVPGTNLFYSSVPGILLPGETYTGELFETALSAAAPSGDYAGTVTLKGGAGQLSSDTLATGSFAVLSPDVSVSVTDAIASEFGPNPGVFTVSRTGRTDISLSVPVTFAGSAVNGTAYQTLSSPVVIPAGAATQNVTLTPIPDSIAQGDRTATLTLGVSPFHNNGTASGASLTIQDKPADAWRLAHFGPDANTPAAADTADWNGDGISNQLAYALGLDPVAFDLSKLPAAAVSGGHYQLSWTPNPAAIDVTLAPEASTDLTTWTGGTMEPVQGGAPGTMTYRYQTPIGQTPRVFLRLRATRIP